MLKKPFMPKNDNGKSSWISNLAVKLKKYAARYGISDAEVADTVAGALFFAYWLDYISQSKKFSLTLTAYKNEVRDGVVGNKPASNQPVPPDVINMPPMVLSGIFSRANNIVGRIKGHSSYTEADGQDMGLIGTDETMDKGNAKPSFSIRMATGGHPEIVWKKGKMTGAEIWVDRDNTGTFTMADVSTSPKYTDMNALPSVPALWNYKLIYRLGNQQMGQWSNVVSVTVHG